MNKSVIIIVRMIEALIVIQFLLQQARITLRTITTTPHIVQTTTTTTTTSNHSTIATSQPYPYPNYYYHHDDIDNYADEEELSIYMTPSTNQSTYLHHNNTSPMTSTIHIIIILSNIQLFPTMSLNHLILCRESIITSLMRRFCNNQTIAGIEFCPITSG
jgi:hypothetical protein